MIFAACVEFGTERSFQVERSESKESSQGGSLERWQGPYWWNSLRLAGAWASVGLDGTGWDWMGLDVGIQVTVGLR